jgi:RNA polymerase sigma-70 factor (ECF subfamily)
VEGHARVTRPPVRQPDDAFDALVRASYDDLLRFAVRRVGSDDAADVLSDVFLIAWRRWTELPDRVDRLWLFGVAGNVIANQRRGELRRRRLALRLVTEAPRAVVAPHTGRSDALRAALATLPPAEREALMLTEWDGFDAGEAARVAGCSRATFRVRLHRARRRLAAQLTLPAEDHDD